MYNKILTGIVVVLCIAIISMLGYIGYGYVKKFYLNSEAEKFLTEEFDTMVVEVNDEQQEVENNVNEITANTNTNANKKPQSTTTYTNGLYYKGFEVIGKLEMPTINIQYPILGDSTKAKAIEVAVLRIYGPSPNNPGNLVIAGHNYNNGLFFGKNKYLQIGDKIYITDMNGKKVEYTIYNKYTIPESDNSYITRDVGNNTEVTLCTCDATGKNRLIVCARAN
ncbi:MAG: sortase [Clostridiales bacterium]|nr:sortase [Clostridiales bacterium]